MSGAELTATFFLPVGLGLFGFVEPCAIGSTLLFIKLMEGKSASVKVAQVALFAVTRALFIGLPGGHCCLHWQRISRLSEGRLAVFGLIYAAIGALYLTGHVSWLMRSIGLRLAMVGDFRTSALLGLVFGLNIPACAGRSC